MAASRLLAAHDLAPPLSVTLINYRRAERNCSWRPCNTSSLQGLGLGHPQPRGQRAGCGVAIGWTGSRPGRLLYRFRDSKRRRRTQGWSAMLTEGDSDAYNEAKSAAASPKQVNVDGAGPSISSRREDSGATEAANDTSLEPSGSTSMQPRTSTSGDDSRDDKSWRTVTGNAKTLDYLGIPGDFCIIEGRDTVQDFAPMQLQDIKESIASRRNKIFLLMEEVRRLRIQERLKLAERDGTPFSPDPPENYPSFIPFLPPLNRETLKEKYYAVFFSLIVAIIVFGGLLAPAMELKLGLGGTTYRDFILSMHLPVQLSEVDPIVASFSGGGVGVLSALLIVEANNVKLQEHKTCHYCRGTGYLACAGCSGSGAVQETEAELATVGAQGERMRLIAPVAEPRRLIRCSTCSGAGKVMCTTCLCTGRALATEHDPRIDPFD